MAKKKKAVSSRGYATSSTASKAPVSKEEEEIPSVTIDVEKVPETIPEIVQPSEVDNDRVIKMQVDLLFDSPPVSCKSPFSVTLGGSIEYSLIQTAKSSNKQQESAEDIKSITLNGLSTVFLSLEVFPIYQFNAYLENGIFK
jgi:hypothetical protein